MVGSEGFAVENPGVNSQPRFCCRDSQGKICGSDSGQRFMAVILGRNWPEKFLGEICGGAVSWKKFAAANLERNMW